MRCKTLGTKIKIIGTICDTFGTKLKTIGARSNVESVNITSQVDKTSSHSLNFTSHRDEMSSHVDLLLNQPLLAFLCNYSMNFVSGIKATWKVLHTNYGIP